MRIILLFILALHIPPAFAIKSLMSPCERKLTIGTGVEVNLKANEIALTGPLTTYWEQGMEDRIGWIIFDDWVRRYISPNGSEFVHWVTKGDRVFILNADGSVKVSGYFGEKRVPVQLNAPPFNLGPGRWTPFLYKDRELQEPVTEEREMREYFTGGARAVVVKTFSERGFERLVKQFRGYFKRFEQNKSLPQRFVRIGRRRAHELSHFQIPIEGRGKVTSTIHDSAIFEISTGEYKKGPDYTIHKYAVLNGAAETELDGDDYLYLIDENGLVTLEGPIGSPAFPIQSTDAEEMAKLAEKIRTSAKVFVAKLGLRNLE